MIRLALGRRLLGKTTLVYSMALKCTYRIVLDPRGMIHSQSGLRVQSEDEFLAAIDRMYENDETIREIIWTPRADLARSLDVASDEVTRWFETFPTRRVMFVIDEARFFRNLETSQPLDYVLRASPQSTVDISITAHRPKDVPVDIRAIGDYWLMFKHTQEHDLKAIEERCGEDVRKQVSALDRYQFIQWDDGNATAKAYRNPSAWFVPLNQPRTGTEPVSLLDSDGEALDLVDRRKLF